MGTCIWSEQVYKQTSHAHHCLYDTKLKFYFRLEAVQLLQASTHI